MELMISSCRSGWINTSISSMARAPNKGAVSPGKTVALHSAVRLSN
ncbi:MAG: hypothetical protein ABW007_20675 [Chitinophagaceae bacterium]